MNTFGEKFRYTTWGESHGKAIGVVIDGCPSGIPLTEEDIDKELFWRRPGQTLYSSPRKEEDRSKILSGVFEGVTTGAPLLIMIENKDADSSQYANLATVLRPGHANYTYLQKYGIFDYRGGGRASVRETACRVAAGAVAHKILSYLKIDVVAYLLSLGTAQSSRIEKDYLWEDIVKMPLFSFDQGFIEKSSLLLEEALKSGDTFGGSVGFCMRNVPVGLGEPAYGKVQSILASALMSIPSAKAFEIGEGTRSASMKGSEYNDLFTMGNKKVCTLTNHQGGIQGGITNGMPVWGSVYFKPISSIKKPQQTLNLQGESVEVTLSQGARHDPCTCIRAVPIVRSMCCIVLVDLLLRNLPTKIETLERHYLQI